MDVCTGWPSGPATTGLTRRRARRALGLAVAVLLGAWSGAGPGVDAHAPSSLVVTTASASQDGPSPSQPATQARPEGQPAASASQDGQPPPVFRAGINFVRVDVIVSDKQGRPVSDLTQADVEVYEDNKPQTVETFKLITLDGNPRPGDEAPRAIRSDFDEESEAQREDVRIFVFVLDDYHVRRGSSMGVRQPLISFIRTQLGPMDLIGVMYPLTPIGDVRLTRNHESVIRVIEKFDGRKFDYTPRNQFEEQYSMYPVEVVERMRNQVSLSAIKAIAVRLGGLREGRKSIILVSEGYSHYVPPQLRDPNAEMAGMGNPNRRNPMAGENSMTEDRNRFFSDVDLQNDMRDVYAACSRANTAIYSLDPRGLAVFEFDVQEGVGMRQDSQSLSATQDSLRTLSSETDGRAIVNRNDLEGGLEQVVRDSSAYYLVGYNSTQAPSDGKFHEIKVRVKRPGVQVRARKGYWALTAEEATRVAAPPKAGPERGITQALASVGAVNRARLVNTWIGMTPADDGRTRVTFVWEPVAAVPGDRRESPSRVSLLAAGGDGQAFFRGKVPGDSAAAASRVSFEATPGKMQMRLSIEGAAGEVIDSDLVDVEVPDFTAPQVALTTLAVYRARTAREFQQLAADAQAVPFAGREFRRTDRLLIRFGARTQGDVPITPTAALLNRAGQKMVDLPVQPGNAGQAPGFVIDLPLASLPSGEYVVEVKAGDASGEAKQFLGVRVIS